jgi:hypothetical protein
MIFNVQVQVAPDPASLGPGAAGAAAPPPSPRRTTPGSSSATGGARVSYSGGAAVSGAAAMAAAAAAAPGGLGPDLAPAYGNGAAGQGSPIPGVMPEPAHVETRHVDAEPGRNDPCYCGSGKKYKKCHGA